MVTQEILPVLLVGLWRVKAQWTEGIRTEIQGTVDVLTLLVLGERRG